MIMLAQLQLEWEIFLKINPPKFLGSQIGEDPQNIIDEVKKIFEVM